MMRQAISAFPLVALLAACGQGGGGNQAADNSEAANMSAVTPANPVAALPTVNELDQVQGEATAAAPEALEREKASTTATPVARQPGPPPKAPAPRDEPPVRAAPKPKPTPAPTPTADPSCTPEHRAMGHC